VRLFQIPIIDAQRDNHRVEPQLNNIPVGLPDQLRPFVRDGKVTIMPSRRATRMLLLDHVAQAFEPGRRYQETAVNEILKNMCDDHAAMRRYLVDHGLLSRTPDGTYWRSGGTVTFRG
jgi:hypothetical protein